jgi:anti-anti-sigma regulatory factor
MSCRISFPARLDVASVAALREEWLPQVNGQSLIEIDCAALELMSASAGQMIVAVSVAATAASGEVTLVNVAQPLRDDLMLLGLSNYLGERASHG